MTVGDHTTPLITLDRQNMEKVDKFQYHGSYLSADGVDIREGLVRLHQYSSDYGPFGSAVQ